MTPSKRIEFGIFTKRDHLHVIAENTDEIRQLALTAAKVLPLDSARLGDEYYYHGLSQCVIDAVFSIGVRYTSVQNVVGRYCKHFGLPRYRQDRKILPQPGEQEPLSALCDQFDEIGVDGMTEIFQNRQRTSARSGILKSEAVLRFARTLGFLQVKHFQDLGQATANGRLEQEIKLIPGQTSGISFQYFLMLAGSDEYIKPDRMIIRFLECSFAC